MMNRLLISARRRDLRLGLSVRRRVKKTKRNLRPNGAGRPIGHAGSGAIGRLLGDAEKAVPRYSLAQ